MRIAGVTVPDNKHLEYSLTSVYGIGRTRAVKILNEAGVALNKTAKDLSQDEENTIRGLIEGFMIEGDLRRDVAGNIKRLKDVQAYRGTRHARNLPVHGQRTKTNSRTSRGNVRKTMTSGRRKLEKT